MKNSDRDPQHWFKVKFWNSTRFDELRDQLRDKESEELKYKYDNSTSKVHFRLVNIKEMIKEANPYT
jgi:hypothetical protein